MKQSPGSALVINDWTIFAHDMFLQQLEILINQVEGLCDKDPTCYRQKNATKRLAAMAKLAFEVIPQNPSRAEYQQGATLGNNHKHWFRAKFFQQYRLFFRYHQGNRIIVYAWVNDENSKRDYESSDDAYRLFKKMLANGRPPDDWASLLKESQQQQTRLSAAAEILAEKQPK